MKTVKLSNEDFVFIICALRQDLRERLRHRHAWRRPIYSLPADPARVQRAYADIRSLIATLRKINHRYLNP